MLLHIAIAGMVLLSSVGDCNTAGSLDGVLQRSIGPRNVRQGLAAIMIHATMVGMGFHGIHNHQNAARSSDDGFVLTSHCEVRVRVGAGGTGVRVNKITQGVYRTMKGGR